MIKDSVRLFEYVCASLKNMFVRDNMIDSVDVLTF